MYLEQFLNRYPYSNDEKETFLNTFKVLTQTKVYESLALYLKSYEEQGIFRYKEEIVPLVDAFQKETSINSYTITFVVLVLFSEKLQKKMSEHNIPQEIFDDTMRDLFYKCKECELVKNTTGTFVGWWYPIFFDLKLFALGRLEFELIQAHEEYTGSFGTIKKGDPLISVHIPRTGTPLDQEEVEESFTLAKAFFKEYFHLEKVHFFCESWLLNPTHKEALNETSNILNFMNHFELIQNGEDDGYGEIWRLFDQEYDGDFDHLPKNSSLRRFYVSHFQKGGKFGWGLGIK